MNNIYQNLRVANQTDQKKSFIESIRQAVRVDTRNKSRVPTAIIGDTSDIFNTTRIFPSKASAYGELRLTSGQREDLRNKGFVDVGMRTMFVVD